MNEAADMSEKQICITNKGKERKGILMWHVFR